METWIVSAVFALAGFGPIEPPGSIEIQIADGGGKVVASQSGKGSATLRTTQPLAPGHHIAVQGGTRFVVRLGEGMPEALVYCPQGRFAFPIPEGKAARAYEGFKAKQQAVTARLPSAADLAAERNLALNPYDTDASKSFPHATTNNVCRDDPVFAARNVIDGVAKAKGHGGWPHQSWGPDKKDGLWLRIDFGRTVTAKRLALVLRADVPHDAFFAGATLAGSDGTRKALTFKPTGDRQTFDLGALKVTWLELRDFPKPPKWAAITEIEVWGVDGGAPAKEAAARPAQSTAWREAVAQRLAEGPSKVIPALVKQFPQHRLELEALADWTLQDKVESRGRLQAAAIQAVVSGLGDAARDLRAEMSMLEMESVAVTDSRWAELYLRACERRRAARFAPHRAMMGRVVFTKHYDLGGSHYAYTEGQSDAQNERHFRAGTALCVLDLDGLYGRVTTLVNDAKGVIRDPDVSFDGKRVLFAWKKDLNKDDYHLYEMSLADGNVRQLTDGLGFADYEGAYLPNGDIVFNSSRCVQSVDCWWVEVSNLYTCDGDGRFLRRLSFDQVHTNYPAVTPDGRVLYTRWDYNDRGQIYPQGLFQMFPDGTGQTEHYGNNSWFPTAILHARAIAGSRKIVCVLSGHHSRQKGWLALIDENLGRQENAGTQLIAPVRETKAVRVDAYGQSGDQWQYPYPLSETEYLVTFLPQGAQRFAIYWMNINGERELLVSDPRISCNQPVPLAARLVPHERPSLVNYRAGTGVVFLHDIYDGPGLEGVPRGTIKKLRVVTMEFRAAAIGSNGNSGPAGGAMASTPVSIQGAWDPKLVLGTATVHPDGSACFTVPARTPIYFQALNEKGHMVQTMRSWSTLQPGETLSCVGCHEVKGKAPAMTHSPQALRDGAQPLDPWEGGAEWFSFVKHVQPILDKHCIRCHYERNGQPAPVKPRAFDPKAMRLVAPVKDARWRYTEKNPGGEWFKTRTDDSAWALALGGFGDAGVPGSRAKTPWKANEIWLRHTFKLDADDVPAAPAILLHHDDDAEVYINDRLALRAPGFVTGYFVYPMDPRAAQALRPGTNLLAVHCVYRGGGRYIDAAIVDVAGETPKVAAKPAPPGVEPAFSLLGTQTLDARSQRKWSDAYIALANRRYCNWINIQSEPTLLPPYTAGAARSKLIPLLESGHYDAKLTPREIGRFALWIDLLVPYVGDYREAMNDSQIPRYDHFLAKRKRMAELEARNIAALLEERR